MIDQILEAIRNCDPSDVERMAALRELLADALQSEGE